MSLDDDLKGMDLKDLKNLYLKERAAAIETYGFQPHRFSESLIRSESDVIARLVMLRSSVLAGKESMLAVKAEDTEYSPEKKEKRRKALDELAKIDSKILDSEFQPKKESKVPTTTQDTRIITRLITDNPKRGASRNRFDHYRTGMTVQEYIDLVGNRTLALGDVKWDSGRNLIRVEAAVREEAA